MPLRDSFAVILAFLVLWAVTAVPVLQSPLGHYPVVDASWHNLWAEKIAGGDVFIYAPYFRAPLYPAVLGLVYFITGTSVISGAILSMLFGVFSVHLVQRIVFDRAGRKASVVAASIWILYGVNLFYSTTLLITPMYTFVLLASFYLLDRGEPAPSGWFVLGLAAVTRPVAIVLFPLAMILYRRNWKKSWLFFIPVAAVWAVNAFHGDRLTVISSQGGINLYIGSGPDADGFTAFAPEGRGALPDSLPYVDNVWAASYAPFDHPMRPSQVSSYWVSETVSFVTAHPVDFAVLTAKKLVYLISPVAIPSNYDVYYFARYSPVLRVLAGTPNFPVSGLLVWFVVPGALLAGKFSAREKSTLLWLAVLAIFVLPFFVTARFRLPIVPFMVILLVPRALRNVGRSLLFGLLGVIAGVGLASVTSGTVSSGGVNMAFYDGVAHFQQGDLSRSEALLHEALEVALRRQDGIDLNGVDALYNLGVISAERQNFESAGMYWELALERDPDFAPARIALLGLTRKQD